MSRTATSKAPMEWKDSYRLGVEEIDAQHQNLLTLINGLRKLADSEKPSRSECYIALSAMIRYAETHFQTEEDYFSKYAYPEYEQQKKEHDAFVEKAFSMAQKLEKAHLALREIVLYLEDWYADHVLGSDLKSKAFLQRKLAEERK